jgi:hypothetical protein
MIPSFLEGRTTREELPYPLYDSHTAWSILGLFPPEIQKEILGVSPQKVKVNGIMITGITIIIIITGITGITIRSGRFLMRFLEPPSNTR